MADNTELDAGSGGDTIRTDDIGGVKFPASKITLGADNTDDGFVASANPMPVEISDGTDTALVSAGGALQIDVSSALPAGTNNIGDVDILSVVPGTAATNLGKAEDAVHSSGDTGVMALGVRNDVLAALAGTDGDYAPLQVNASGALFVQEGAALDVSAATVTVDLGANNDVQGAAAEGAAVSGNPFLVAGDDGTNVKHIAVAADGAIHVDDGGNTLTVDGTVTADAGTGPWPVTDNSGSLTVDASQLDIDSLTKDDDEVLIWVNTAKDATGTDYVPIVDADGHLQVDVLSGGGGGTQYAVDAALGATPTGTLAIGIRDDALGALTPVEGDAVGLRVDANGALWTHDDALDAALSGSELQVDIVAELPAGTQAIGKLAANDGVDIGDVTINNASIAVTATQLDIDSLTKDDDEVLMWANTAKDATGTDYVPLVDADGHLQIDVLSGGGGGTQYAVDAALGATPTGTLAIARRDDALGGLTPVEDDAIALRVDANGALWTHDNALDAALSGSELQVDVVAALPAGANTIGAVNVVANDGVDIGDVDVASVVPGTAATSLGKAEDAVHSSGDTGVMSLAVRNDVLAALAGTDGDYAPLQVNASGALFIQEGSALDVSAATVTVSATQLDVDSLNKDDDEALIWVNTAKDATGTDVVPLADADGHLQVDVLSGGGAGTEYAVDAALGATPTGTLAVAIRDDALSALTPVEGDAIGLRVDANGALWTHDDALDVALSGSELQVDVVAALPAGANTIGAVNIVANDGTDIGDVDVTSVIPGTAATNLGKAEDAVHGSGDTGVMALAVRNDVLAALAGTDGDYSPLQVNASGALFIQEGSALDVSAATVTVSATQLDVDSLTKDDDEVLVWANTAKDGTGTDYVPLVDADGHLQVDMLSGGGGTQYAVDAALGATPTGTLAVAIRDDALSALTPIEGDAIGLRVDANGALWTHDDALDAALSGSQLQVDVVASLPAGTNNIGAVTGQFAEGVAPSSALPFLMGADDGSVVRNVNCDANGNLQVDIVSLNKAVDSIAGGSDTGAVGLYVRDDALGGITPAEGDYATGLVDANGALWTHDNALDAALSGSELQVDIVAELPAGTQTIGKLGSNSGVDIGDVDVKSVFPGTSGASLGKAIDDAAGATDTGVAMLAVRDDEQAALTPVDGDYVNLRTDRFGNLKVTELPDATSVVKYAVIDDALSGDNELVGAAGAGIKIRVLAAFMISAGTVAARFESGAAGTALTGQMNLVANSGFTLPYNPAGWFETADNTALNLELSAAISVDGCLTYVEV